MDNKLIELIKKNKDYLIKNFDIKKIGVFGSYTRGEESLESDIDILIEFEIMPDLFKYIDIEIYLENLLHKKVDLVEKNSIREELKDRILQDVQYI